MFSVIQHYELELDANISDKALKQMLGQQLAKMPRRMDRLALLTLLLAVPFRGQLASNSGIYLAADYPSLGNMHSLLDTVIVQQQLPKPFEFINSVSNAASFYAAQMLALDGPNVFIGAGKEPWQPLTELAFADLQCHIVPEVLLIRCLQGKNQLCGQAVHLRSGHWQPTHWQFSDFATAPR
ncbi:hypothetical protein E0Z06_14840 [Rheinheimera sp. D18]|uniref:hypothetical protein n=1 Tax=Rheinheimera sp. D18 TaxID=2545632 RepID=UPI001046028D|nr:hypothetical protein [Rheinheimera sp. D18]QBL10707.1 hypothetical protein E0Z06_14840 [Rheinheimera sp. D18]